jgi:DNA helicase HerA-like ATPase
MDGWYGFEFHRLVEVPAPQRPDGEERPQQSRPESSGPLAASLAGSHADLLGTGQPAVALVTAWLRVPGEPRLQFLVGGRPFFPPAGPKRTPPRTEHPPARAERTPPGSGASPPGPEATSGVGTPDRPGARQVLFPPGALADALPPGQAEAILAAFEHWVPCAGRPDALWAPGAPHHDNTVGRRGSFTRHVAHLRGPFAWLVVAEPLPPQELKPELDLLVGQILPLTRGEVGEAKRIALERKQARHRELSRAQVGGAWRIRVLVGGADGPAAANAAALLCAATDLDGLQYALAPADRPMPLAEALRAAKEDEHGGRAAFTAGTELLVALTRPPERELPGLRLVEPHTFDVTPEPGDGDRDEGGAALPLGDVLDATRTPVAGLALYPDSLNRHTFVCGATGTGKSQTVRHLLTEATRTGLPWLAVEPAKAEYALMGARIAGLGGDVVVIRPGDRDAPPAGFNPLEPAPGFSLQTHADLLRALFLAAFEAQEPFPQILAAALTRCYEELGWDLTLGRPVHPDGRPRYPNLGDLQRVAALVVTEIGYGKEISDNIQGFIKVRLGSLRLGTTGRFFEGGHRLDFDLLRTRNVVLEIEDVGDDADKAFLMGAVLMRLTEHLRVAAREGTLSGRLEHLTVVEEAHRLLRRAEPGATGPATHAVEMFAALLAEIRAYGEGLIIAEQIPSKLTPDVIKNTAVKIVHRLPAQDDRDSVGATMNVDKAQSRYLVTLHRGEGAVFTDGMDRPVLVRVPDGSGTERSAVRGRAPVGTLIRPRSLTCGPACVAQACTLAQMRSAQHLLATRPWLTIWAELTVLAHLTAGPVPLLDPRQLTTVEGVAQRELDCALSHAVDDAVAVRSAALQRDAAPVDLATHCVDVLSSQIVGAGVPVGCAYEEPLFFSRPHRWLQVLDALQGDPGGDGPHPDTARWERRFLCRIPGATRAEQYEVVHAWSRDDLADRATRDGVTFGTRRPSALEAAIGGDPDRVGWPGQVRRTLEPFDRAGWALEYLLPDSPQKTSIVE